MPDDEYLSGELEGGGSGGGSESVDEQRAERPPGSRVVLGLTVLLVVVAVTVPVMWALGLFASLAPGLGPGAAAGYLLLVVVLAAGALLDLWGQLGRATGSPVVRSAAIHGRPERGGGESPRAWAAIHRRTTNGPAAGELRAGLRRYPIGSR